MTVLLGTFLVTVGGGGGGRQHVCFDDLES